MVQTVGMDTPLLPPLRRCHQHYEDDRVHDVGAHLTRRLDGSAWRPTPGTRVAITAGSRGIVDLPPLLAALVAWLKAHGAQPFLVPAMGSHGGATADGQRLVLEELGITESTVGAPIRSSMEVTAVPAACSPIPVFLDRMAYEADTIVVVNRIKPHTSFHSRHESGLAKMLAIGLGKERMASAIHALGPAGLRDLIPKVAADMLATGKVAMGIAVVENAFERACLVEVVPGNRILDQEPGLLETARRRLPRLPIDALDLLIVDAAGKDVSGLGMDPNVIGRLAIRGESEPESPRIGAILLRSLTEASCGNATGMGLADVITRRFRDAVDLAATYRNVVTTGFLERAKLPLVADTDAQALAWALRSLPARPAQGLRVARIRNTKALDEFLVSPAVRDVLHGRPGISVDGIEEGGLIGEDLADW